MRLFTSICLRPSHEERLMEALVTTPFYTNPLPQKDDIVIAEVVDFNDIHVNLFLPEYGQVKAFLPTTEINVRRGKRVKDYVKIGQEIAVQVISVTETGPEGHTDPVNIDVSMKVVKSEETKDAFDKYHKALKVHKTIGDAAKYKSEAARKLYQELRDQFETDLLYPIFEEIRAGKKYNVSVELLKAIEERMPAPLFTQEADLVITYPYEKDGAAKVAARLDKISQMENVKIFVVAPPKYKVIVTAMTKERAEELLAEAMAS